MQTELATHFPARYGGAESEQLLYYQQQQKRLLAQCAWLRTQDARHLATVAEIDEWLLSQLTPQIFDDDSPANVLHDQRRRFGQLCAALSGLGYPRPHELSVFDFNSAVDYLNSKQKPA